MKKTTGRKVRGVAACAMAGCLALAFSPVAMADAAPAQASTSAAKVKASTSKKSGTIRTIKVKKTSSLSGNVTYKLYSKGKTFSGKNGKKVGDKKKVARALSVKLSGKLASNYDVYYRVNVKGYGWLGWAKNGKKAGTANLEMTKCTVKLVAKTATPLNTDRMAYSGKSGFVNKITGDARIDAAIKKVAKSQGMNLNKCFTWANKNIKYAPTGRFGMTKTSQYNAARLKTEAKAAFIAKQGDCYTYTAAGACFAKYLGYTGKAAVGTYTSSTGKVQTYSWATVKLNGKTFIQDVTNSRLNIAPADELYAQFKQI